VDFRAGIHQRLPVTLLKVFQVTLSIALMPLFTVQVGLPLTILDVVAPFCGAKNKYSRFRAQFVKYIKILVERAVRQLVYIVKMDDATKLCTCAISDLFMSASLAVLEEQLTWLLSRQVCFSGL